MSRRPVTLLVGLLGCVYFPNPGLCATFYTTVSQGVGQSWTNAIWTNTPNPTAVVAVPGNTYVAVSDGVAIGNNLNATRLRNPAFAGVQTFPGDTLTLNTNTEVRMKQVGATLNFPGAGVSPGVILNGGMLSVGDSGAFTVSGLLEAAPGSYSYFCPGNNDAQSVDNNRTMNIIGQLSGSGTLVLFEGGNQPQQISCSSNTFSGKWIVKCGYLQGTVAGTIGTNSVTVDPQYVLQSPPFDVSISNAQAGPAIFEVNYDLASSGVLTLTNGGQMRLHQNCSFTGVNIESNSLSPGLHAYAELNGNFPNNFPSGGSGSITVLGSVPTNGPPVIVTGGQPASQTHYLGQTAQFMVTAGGQAPLHYQWEAGPTNSGIYTNLSDGGQFSGANTATLSVNNLTLSNTADFVVVVTNSLGSITSSVARLTVFMGPPLNLTLTNSTAQQEDWNTPNRWSDGNSAAVSSVSNPGSTYDVPANLTLRSPDLPLGSGSGTTNDIFPGVQLTVEGNGALNNSPNAGPNIGALLLKHNPGGTNYFTKLVMNGGQLDQAETGLAVMAGEMDILAYTPIYNDNTEDRGFRIDSWLTGSGTVEYDGYNLTSFQTNYTSTLNVTGTSNAFSGKWNIVVGTLLGTAPGALGTNSITIGNNAALETTYDINNPNGSLTLNGRVFLHQNDTFATVTVGPVGLTAGTYTFAQLNAAYPTYFPASWTPQQGASSFSTGSGSITALATAPPPPRPSTNVLESTLVRLTVYGNPFSFNVVEKSTGNVLLQQTENQFTIGGAYTITGATNFVLTQTTMDADLVLSGSSVGGHLTFNFIQPGIIQTTLSSSNNSPSMIFQQFLDQGEDIFGGFECPTGGTLSTRNFSHKLAASFGVNNVVNGCGGKAPFYLTTRHYGIYAETDALGTLTFAQGGFSSFSFNVPQLTYDIIYGPDYATIMAGFNTRSGPSFLPPLWAFDSIWWKDDDHFAFHNGVTNAQGNVLDTAMQLTNYQIHAGSEWIDRPYGTSCGQGDGGWGNMDFDSSFPNPPQMVSALRSMGMNLMLWISDLCWCDLYNEGLAYGYLFSTGNNTTANFQNPSAYNWFQTNLNGFVNLGVTGYKIDRGDQGELPDSVNNLNDTLFQQLAVSGLNTAVSNYDFAFSRCASDTGRKYTALWNGDTYCTFTGLQYSVISGLRAGIINFPMWGSDTGGYIGTPTEELFARWLEFSAYSTMMEVLVGGSRTPWYDYSTNLIGITRTQAAAHHDLMPYSRSHFYQATQTGMPVMRPIMFAYPNDTNNVATLTNCEYLFGGQILVAPIITAGATNRYVYLPAANWLDYNSRSNVYAGPATILASAPLNLIPLYINEGAIVPRGDIYGGNNSWTPNWSPQLRLEFFPSDQFASTFPYYTGAAVQNITCSSQNHTLTIQFGDLGLGGNLDVYVVNPSTVTRNGTRLSFGTDYTYFSTSNLLRVPFSGATTLVINDVTSLFSAPAPLEAWRLSNFGNTGNPAISSLSASPAGDGVPNFLKYAFGLNPLVAVSNGLPVGKLVADMGINYLALTFQRATNATDCTFTVWVSPDLNHWLAGSSYSGTNVVPSTTNTTELSRIPSNVVEIITVRDNVPVSSAPERFMKVRVTNP